MTKNKKNNSQSDGLFILKIVLYFIIGCLWIEFGIKGEFILPIGLLIGLLFASHDHFMIDRKIEYIVLIFATILSFIAPIGFVLNIS